MADLSQLRHIDNLRRAWRWIRSNPDASYKTYLRPLYQNFAIAEESLLADLGDRLRRDVYEPEASCKLYLPKASGILRPISLLSVEDQIAYQAATNLIAEKLKPRAVQRYNKQVFGHLYAGKSSTWFYRKWSNGYKAFNEAARKAHSDGYVYTASFDLTACYDSLDHRVLRHFLDQLGLDPDFCTTFTAWLEKWTATERGIFHNHGIPQGPLSSGLVSEVVLAHFDELRIGNVDFHYFRYVDDIRLFATSEHDLRRLLVALDLLSKDVGLFPQSGKISIHRVQNIDDELKTISNPLEAPIRNGIADQGRLVKRLEELTPRYRITNATRFKYLLAHASPSARLTARLWRILEKHPEIYRSVCNYLRRYKKIPRVPATRLVAVVKENNLYQAIRAEFINAADGRLPSTQDRTLARVLRQIWLPKVMHADLQVATGRFLIRTGSLSATQIAYACKVAPSWWARACLIESLDLSRLGTTTLSQIVDIGIRDKARDAALAAAWKGKETAHIPPGNRRGWNKSAELLLRELGMVKRSTAAYCGINHALRKLDTRIPEANWRRLFGTRYSQAELQVVEISAASGVNITGFVNLLDVFNDLLLNAVVAIDGTLGVYNLGHLGSVLNAPTGRLATKIPKTYDLAAKVHERRYESMASHPLIRRTGAPTKRISYKFLPIAKKLVRDAVEELRFAGVA